MKSAQSRKRDSKASKAKRASASDEGMLAKAMAGGKAYTGVVIAIVVLLLGAGGYFAWHVYANREPDYERLLKESPAFPLYQRGVAAAMGGRSAEAVESFERALREDSSNALIYNALATQHLRDRDPIKAIRVCEESLFKAPNSADVYYTYGLAQYQIGKYQEALQAFNRSLELRESYAQVHLWAGKTDIVLATMAGGEAGLEPTLLGNAIDEFRRAIELEPNVAEYHAALAEGLFQRRELTEAREAIQRAVEIEPKSATYVRSLGKICDNLDDLECAEAAYTKSIELDPSAGEAYYGLGVVQAKSGRDAEAVESFRRALQRNEFDADTHEKLGQSLERLGQTDEAQKELGLAEDSREREKTLQNVRRASAEDPRNAQLATNLGIELARQGDYEGAMQAFNRALSANPGMIDAKYQIAGVYFAQSRFDNSLVLKALEAFSDVDKQQPGYRWTNFYLSKLNERIGRAPEAKKRMDMFEAQKAAGTLSDS